MIGNLCWMVCLLGLVGFLLICWLLLICFYSCCLFVVDYFNLCCFILFVLGLFADSLFDLGLRLVCGLGYGWLICFVLVVCLVWCGWGVLLGLFGLDGFAVCV